MQGSFDVLKYNFATLKKPYPTQFVINMLILWLVN
nr:MAG TPA: hypothetical protein [Caudoviricetes sp.]